MTVKEGHKALGRFFERDQPEHRIVFDALDFAAWAHQGHQRQSREPYILHPIAVAVILAGTMNIQDPELIAAALLHDVLEDAEGVTKQHLEARFGRSVAEIVEGCTKHRHQRLDRAALRNLTHSKIFLSTSHSLGVILIKLADRLHNMRTLNHLTYQQQQRISQETASVYAPIAAKLNLYELKRELFDTALSILFPRKSKPIRKNTECLLHSAIVSDICRSVQEACAKAGLAVKIRPRMKCLGAFYSQKRSTLQMSNSSNRIDITVVVDSDDSMECYRILGVCSRLFKPVPGSIRDYLAAPKANGYQSLHLRIRTEGEEFLIKIRTPATDMHSRRGMLSHWRIGQETKGKRMKEISELFRYLGEYEGSAQRRRELLRYSQAREIQVWTPKGDVLALPADSIVLDLAYKVHTDLGRQCVGANIEGRRVPAGHLLKDGDRVEVITHSNPPLPEEGLERLCKTPKAKSVLQQCLKARKRHHAEQIGRCLLDQGLVGAGLQESAAARDLLDLFMDYRDIASRRALYLQIGTYAIRVEEILYYLDTGTDSGLDEDAKFAGSPLYLSIPVGSLENGVHRFARCCRPYPGQPATLAALSERGVSIHRTNCRDLQDRHGLVPERLPAVVWNDAERWPNPLLFEVSICGKTTGQFISELADVADPLQIQRLSTGERMRSEPVTNASLILGDYDQSRAFFSRLPGGSARINRFHLCGPEHAPEMVVSGDVCQMDPSALK